MWGLRRPGTGHSANCFAAVAALVIAAISTVGCCTPIVLSHRFPSDEPIAQGYSEEEVMLDETHCGCRSVAGHFLHYAARPHRLLPGSDRDGRGFLRAAEDSNGIVPRPARFHPVPTRPVFARQLEESQGLQGGMDSFVEPIPKPVAEAILIPPPVETDVDESDSPE